MDQESNVPFHLGAKVRIKATGDVGTVQGYYITGAKGKQRALVDRAYGLATMRQSFDLSDIEAAE